MITKLIIISLLGFLVLSTFNYANAVDNNCRTNLVHILELRYTLGCIEDRIDILENTSGGESTTASNLGTVGEGVFASEVGNDLQFKKLVSGTGITLNANSTRIMINSTGGSDTTVCANTGTGNGLHKTGTNCDAYSLIAGSGISISNTTDDWTIANTAQDNTVCTNLGTVGEGVYASGECDFKKLLAGTLTTLTSNGTRITIDVGKVGQIEAQVYQSVTKTNIGTSYVDIYTTAFDEENMAYIDCNNVSEIKVDWIWDYVGTGTQQVRWVDVNNNSNVLYEANTFAVDQDAGLGGWTTKPSWCIGPISYWQIEMQGKSTVAGDDPVAKGYRILTR